jgi:hypothetical protein
MSKVDTGPLRQLYDHLGVEPDYRISSFVAYQLQERNPEERLPLTLTRSIDQLRDLAVMSRDYLQIGALDFALGLDFLHGGRNTEAVGYFEAARRQWLFIDHLPLIALAHFGAGMAHHETGDYRQAAGAYFKAMQCLQQAGAEPHRLEKIEVERSLQAFWNDLERGLNLAVAALRRDFSQEQDEMLRAEVGDVPGEQGAESGEGQSDPDVLAKLTLEMQPAGSMSADDVDALVLKSVDGIERLSAVLAPSGTEQNRPRPTISRLYYTDQSRITIEIDNVAKHAVNLIRWLVTSVTPVEPSNAGSPQSKEGSETWFRWQARPGHIAEIIKTFVQSATGEALDETASNELIEVIGHLAELRLNCQLTVK